MRKIGIEIFYWIPRWADDQVAYFSKARGCGFDSVEISFVSGPENIDIPRTREELHRLGLEVFCSTGLSRSTDISSPDKDCRDAGIRYLHQCLETAQKLGSPCLGGVTYAPWLYFPDDADLRPYRDRSATALREVAKVAEDLGIYLTLEILNRFETFMFNTVDEALTFLQHVDHSAVQLQLDTYHMNMEEDNLAAAIRRAGLKIGHFHCAASNRKLPGHGHIDWHAIKSALDAVNYQGALVIETFPDPNAETGRTVNTWRPLVNDPDREIKESLAFLRANVA